MDAFVGKLQRREEGDKDAEDHCVGFSRDAFVLYGINWRSKRTNVQENLYSPLESCNSRTSPKALGHITRASI